MKEIELKERRKNKEKHFLREDGSIVAKVYSDDIHYRKNGKYEEINNTLVKKNNYYTNLNNDYKVYFKDHSDNNFMKLKKDENFLEIKLKNCKSVKLTGEKQISKLVEKVIYEDILEGIDLKYDILPTKVKETIVLKNRKNLKEKLTFVVNTNLNLTLEDGLIVAKNKEEVIFTFEVPYMMDSANHINQNVFYELRKKEDYYELDLILDKNYLAKDEIIYPVYIDPTITNNNQGGNLYDTYIYPGDTNVNRANQDILKAGVEKVNGVNRINRTLIKFDLPQIGTSSEIISANLNLVGYPTSIPQEYPKLVTIHKVTSDWTESGANWSNMNDKYSSKVEGIYYFYRSMISDNEITPMPTLINGNITDLVKKWYSNTPNYGIMIKSSNEVYEDDNYPAFFSKNNTVQGYNPKPTLVITYRNQNGLEDYLDYKVQELTCGTTYVNTYNGNLTGVFDIASTIGSKLEASVSLIYNTSDAVLNNNTVYGKGYKLNFDQTIKDVVIEDNNYLEYLDEDGTIHYFYEDTSVNPVVYYDEDGLELSVTKNTNNYIMSDKNGNKKTFVKNGNTGYLTEIKDVSQNKITIERDSNNLITKVKDSSNCEINLYYDDNKITVVSPSDTTYLNYLDGNLISIETLDGITNISYNTNNLIENITDVTGMKLNYTYYNENPYRVEKITQYGLNDTLGNYFTLSYGFNTTSITDHLGRVNTLIFNSNGNLVSSNSLSDNEDINNAYSTVQTYGEDDNNKNRLLSNTVPVRYIKNYLKNTSFEQDNNYFTKTENIQTTISNEASFSGDKSLKVVSNSDDQVLEQSISLEKGKYYTFSGYFKNNNNIRISLSYIDKDNNTIESIAEVESSNDFVRSDVSIYYSSDAVSDLMVKIYLDNETTIYIDDIQLEEGEVVNNYNMMENSDFSLGLSDWTLEAQKLDQDQTVMLDVNDYFEVVKFNNNKNTALKVKMDPLNRTSFSKDFSVNGKKGDLYHISFWYKNEGIPAITDMISNDVSIFFVPADGTLVEECIFPSTSFPPNADKWQYFSYKFVADRDYKELKLRFNQGRNANDFYITNLGLYKDLASNFYEYDNEGNIISLKDPTKETNTFNYDKNNRLISATTPKGKNFKFEYDNVKTDKVLSAISSMGISNKVEYDSFGNPILTRISKKINEPLENSKYKIRSKGTNKYLKIKNKNILIESDSCSNTIWTLEKVGEDFKIIYSIMPNYSLAYINNKVELTTTNSNNLFILEASDNGSYYIKSKTANKYLKVNNNNLVFTTLIENDYNFEFYIETIEEEFIENSATYSSDGRFVTSVMDSNFNKTLYETNPTTGLTTSMTNANNQTTNYVYNDKKQITSVTQGDKAINYSYNENNQLSKIAQGNKEYNFIYDDFLNIKEIKIKDNITLVTNDYEANNGNLIKTTYGNNNEITFDYDEFDRIKTTHKMDNDYHYKYDNNGNIAKILSNDHITKYTYDIGKRINDYIYDNFKINYKYDSNDNIISKRYKLDNNINNIENTFNKDDLLVKSVLDNQEINYNYDNLGRLINKNIGNSYNTEYDYISNGKRTSELIKSIKNGSNKYSYKYDKLNNITHIYYNDVLQKRYYYDNFNELIKEEDYITNNRKEYEYDNSGNLLKTTTENMLTNSVTNTDTYEYANNNWEDQLTKFNNQEITYDAIGNPLTIGNNITMSWINGRSLNTYTDTTKNLNISYKYNDGIRVSKVVNGTETKYYLEDNDIVYEQRGNDLIYYLYDELGLIGLKYNGNIFHYIKNLQNDIIGILDSNYNQIVSYEYDSWGQVISIKDNLGNEIEDPTNIGLINPFRYRSYYYDQETGLYYLNSRYYNPAWGRFINADGIIGANKDFLSYNLYAYVSNNPINSADPEGNLALTAAGAAGVLLGGALLAYPFLRNLSQSLGVVLQNVAQKIKQVAKSAVKQDTNSKKKEEKRHTVYTLKQGKTVIYVGRTVNPETRKLAHKRNEFRENLEFHEERTDLTRSAARGYEQQLIMKYHTLNKNNPAANQINGVAWDNPRCREYMNAIIPFFDENEVYVGYCK